MLTSHLCTQAQCQTAGYRRWCARLGEVPRLHRKQWEFCAIAQALFERGLLQPGRRGLGFGVGKEPLPALFAAHGCQVVATDLDDDDERTTVWRTSRQHAAGQADLARDDICSPADFARLVRYQPVDMTNVPPTLVDFDFAWSSCVFEHLGSLAAGTDFVLRAMDCLRPGGVAVHTTEYNVSSNEATMEDGSTVLYRRQDIEALATALRRSGHSLMLDFRTGALPADGVVDTPPYGNEPHLKLQIQQYVVTSLLLIITRAA